MPKPSQPATPNNFLHTLNTQPTPQLLTRSSVLQGHSRHPPNHAIFRSHKPLHIILLHRPSFATIHKHPLYTCIHSLHAYIHYIDEELMLKAQYRIQAISAEQWSNYYSGIIK